MAHPKSKRHHLLSILAFNIFGIVLAFGLSQCGGHDEEMAICSPSNVLVYSGSDTIAYVFDGDNRLTEIQYRNRNIVKEHYVMTYTGGKLTGCTHSIPYKGSPDYILETYTLTYGSNNKPATRTYSQGNGPAFETIVYSYDGSEKLVKRVTEVNDNPMRSMRYEYNGDNVSKIYYTQSIGADEILGAEFLTVDNHRRFFAASDDLALVETYIFDYEPSANNVLTMKVYASPGVTYGTPYLYTYQFDYNEQGYVKAITNVAPNAYYSPVFTFKQMNYTCR